MKIKTVFLWLAAASIVMSAASLVAQPAPSKAPFTPYASIRMFIGGVYENKHFYGSDHGDIDLVEHLNATSRLGISFSKGALSGKAEIGLAASKKGGTPYLRHAFFNYKSQMGLDILAGQTDTPMNYPPANDGWNDSFLTGGFGSSNMGRLPQIKLTYSGIYLALISPIYKQGVLGSYNYETGNYHVSGYPGLKAELYDVYMPRVALGYDMKSQMFSGGLGFACFQPFAKGDAKALTGDNEFSYIVYAHGKVDLGAPYVAFNASLQHAPALLGMISALTLPQMAAEIDDTLFEGFVELGYKLPSGSVSIIASYLQNLSKDKDDLNTFGFEILYSHQVVDGFKVVPSVLYATQFIEHVGNPSIVEFGVKLQADL